MPIMRSSGAVTGKARPKTDVEHRKAAHNEKGEGEDM